MNQQHWLIVVVVLLISECKKKTRSIVELLC